MPVIKFTIPVEIKWEFNEPKLDIPILEFEIKHLENSLRKNGRITSDEKSVISDFHGIVHLISKKFEVIDNQTLKIEFEFDCEKHRDNIDPSEIVYAIMPACYSDNPDWRYFYEDDNKYYFEYQSNRKVLEILDTPTFI